MGIGGEVLESVKSSVFRLDAKIRELEQRIRHLEDDKREEEELIAAAFEPPPPDRKTHSRAEVESYGKLRRST